MARSKRLPIRSSTEFFSEPRDRYYRMEAIEPQLRRAAEAFIKILTEEGLIISCNGVTLAPREGYCRQPDFTYKKCEWVSTGVGVECYVCAALR
jgi:hypothetical protein